MSELNSADLISEAEYEAGKDRIVLPGDLVLGLFEMNFKLDKKNMARYGSYAIRFLVDVVEVEPDSRFGWVYANSQQTNDVHSNKQLVMNSEGLLADVSKVKRSGSEKIAEELGYLSTLDFDFSAYIPALSESKGTPVLV